MKDGEGSGCQTCEEEENREQPSEPLILKKRRIDLLPSGQPHSTSLRRLAWLWLAETSPTMENCGTGARGFLVASLLCTRVMLRAVELLRCPVQAGARGSWERERESRTWQVQAGERSGAGSLRWKALALVRGSDPAPGGKSRGPLPPWV